jgi:serine/threonine-protein kinase
LEWEKAAMGADGRIYTWGNAFDASFCCNGDSTDTPSPANVSDFPIDESPYGIRHMSGNMSEWTSSIWHPNGVDLENGKPVPAEMDDQDLDRVVRGGYWEDHPRRLRVGSRDDATIFMRDNYLGFRLVYST